MNQKINPKNWTNIQSYFRDIAASVPKYCNKLSPTMQDTQNSWLPSAYKSYIYTILQPSKCVTVLCASVLSCFSHVWLFATPWTVACQTPLSMVFSRQEYWDGLPCPPPGDFSNPGVEPGSLVSPAQVDSLLLAPPGKPWVVCNLYYLDWQLISPKYRQWIFYLYNLQIS